MHAELTPRERFRRIMAHQEADRVPIDLAGCSLTTAYGEVEDGLRRLLGLEGGRPEGDLSFDERILEALGTDFRGVGGLVQLPGREHPTIPGRGVDMWGVEREWTGQYWDIVRYPLRGATVADLETYPWPDPDECIEAAPLDAYRERARRLYEETDYVVVAEHPVFGVLELACWMCGFDDFLLRMAADPEFVHAFFRRYLDFQKRVIEPYYAAVGPYIHLTTSGDDFGTQRGPFLSPAMFREFIAPCFAERIAFTRRFTDAYYWHHTCGSVHALLPDLIDVGIDILNPVQPGATGMEPERLKADYGDRIVFHGGFDTQQVLPFGTPEEVEAEVARLMAAMKPGGGYIFSAAHNIQADVPPENALAMFRAARRCGAYGG